MAEATFQPIPYYRVSLTFKKNDDPAADGTEFPTIVRTVKNTFADFGLQCWFWTHTYVHRDYLNDVMCIPCKPDGKIDSSSSISNVRIFSRVSIFNFAKQFVEQEHNEDPTKERRWFDEDGYQKAIADAAAEDFRELF